MNRHVAVSCYRTRSDRLTEIFHACDDNNNGWLSFDEYLQLADKWEDEAAVAMMKGLFDRGDAVLETDGKVTLEEFVKFTDEVCMERGLSDKAFNKQADKWLKLAQARDVVAKDEA